MPLEEFLPVEDSDGIRIAASAAEVYDEFFAPALFDQWPEQVLGVAAVAPGHRVLDVGCGTGILTRAAARRVGGEGHVVGLDPNPGMLSVARRSAEPIEWREGAAESLPFEDGSFHRVLSQFAAMFFTDAETAISEMARVLAPSGRMAIATWAPLEESPGYAAMADLLDRLFGEEAADALRAPFTFGDVDRLKDLLSTSLAEVEVEVFDGTARFPSIERWVFTDIKGWTLAEMIDDDQYEALLAAAESEFARFADGTGAVSFPAPALIASGRAPDSRV